MNAYLPSNFLQVYLHSLPGKPARLDSLLLLLAELGIKAHLDIDLLQITQPGLLILPTRMKNIPFSPNELHHVSQFVSDGNPLLHLSNHSPWTKHDSTLGKQFGYCFNGTIRGHVRGEDFEVYPVQKDNPIKLPDWSDLLFVICNSSLVIDTSGTFKLVADFSRSNAFGGDPGGAFAIARGRSDDSGTIVAVGDSGFLGEPRDRFPGPGLSKGDNRQLLSTILVWMISETA